MFLLLQKGDGIAGHGDILLNRSNNSVFLSIEIGKLIDFKLNLKLISGVPQEFE